MKIRNMIYAGCILISGCTLDIPLEDQFSDPDAITDVSSARSLLASAYEALPQNIFKLSVLSDDFYPSSKLEKDAGLQNLYRWRDDELTNFAESLWTEYYQVIAYVNALLARLDGITTVSGEEEAEKTAIRCEAQALKALCYFDLLRLFAPRYEGNEDQYGIILKEKVELDYLPRSSVKECVEEIRRLLSEARYTSRLPGKVYELSDPAVRYLQAEVELYAGNYPEVVNLTEGLLEEYPEEVLGNAAYSALWGSDESAARIFGKYQLEQIYDEIRYEKFENGDYLLLNDEITYEDQDIRKAWGCMDFIMDNNRPVRLFGKYNRMNREEIPGRYVNMFRAAGIWLMRAEALACTSQPVEAVKLMNRMLAQRGAGLWDSGVQGEELVEKILGERRKEFAGEGVRYFDLKRCGKAVKRYGAYGNNVMSVIEPDNYRWTLPLPGVEYRYNDNVKQNEGWPTIGV